MFDVGLSELLLVFVVALVVLGPERLPKVARTVGHWLGRARATFNHLKSELDREVANHELLERLKAQEDALRTQQEELQRLLQESDARPSPPPEPPSSAPEPGTTAPAAPAADTTADSNQEPRP